MCALRIFCAPTACATGELQLAFLLFLRLSSLRALQHWKALAHLMCGCEDALASRPGLYVKLLLVLRAQLALAPADFFEDALSEASCTATHSALRPHRAPVLCVHC